MRTYELLMRGPLNRGHLQIPMRLARPLRKNGTHKSRSVNIFVESQPLRAGPAHAVGSAPLGTLRGCGRTNPH